jgi:predicted lipoprotein
VGSPARKSSSLKLSLVLTVALLAAVPVAAAIEGEPTREEYVAAVEPICKANIEANSRILKGVKTQVKQGDLVPAGRRFLRAATALGRSVRQIAAEPKPGADAAKLDKWIGYLKQEKTFLQKIGKALKAKNRFQAQQYAVKLNKNNNRANNTVISFGFDHCRIDSSKFL